MCLDNEVAEPLKMNAIRMNAARLGHRKQQEVELLERIGQLRQKIKRFPARVRRHARFTVRLLVIRLDQEGAQARVELWQRDYGLGWSRPRRCVALLVAQE